MGAVSLGRIPSFVYSIKAFGRASCECMGKEVRSLFMHQILCLAANKARQIQIEDTCQMTSSSMRKYPNFIRDGLPCEGEFEIPIIHRESLPQGEIDLVACSRTRWSETAANRKKGVHFFVDDYRFRCLRYDVTRNLEKYGQYAFLLSPDFSRYSEMPTWQVIDAIGMNRWCGAVWQKMGYRVIPSVGWATPYTYRFCFKGVERNAPVAITTNGNRRAKRAYLHGYDAMLDALDPSTIICLGSPFPEMRGNIISVKYDIFRKEA